MTNLAGEIAPIWELNPLWETLTEEERTRVLGKIEIVQYTKNEMIHFDGEESSHMGMLISMGVLAQISSGMSTSSVNAGGAYTVMWASDWFSPQLLMALRMRV